MGEPDWIGHITGTRYHPFRNTMTQQKCDLWRPMEKAVLSLKKAGPVASNAHYDDYAHQGKTICTLGWWG